METNGKAVPSTHSAAEGRDDIRNVIIIGSGPAGYTAALYTARANLSPLLIAGNADPKTSRIKGGQLMFTSDIENFPGTGEGISGPELMQRMEHQARHFGGELGAEGGSGGGGRGASG